MQPSQSGVTTKQLRILQLCKLVCLDVEQSSPSRVRVAFVCADSVSAKNPLASVLSKELGILETTRFPGDNLAAVTGGGRDYWHGWQHYHGFDQAYGPPEHGETRNPNRAERIRDATQAWSGSCSTSNPFWQLAAPWPSGGGAIPNQLLSSLCGSLHPSPGRRSIALRVTCCYL